jgi:uncharacterized protein YcsI (UPF0317 family)
MEITEGRDQRRRVRISVSTGSGDPVEIRRGEIPVFWACGVTPQAALMTAKPPFAITHAPGHMFVTDLRDADMEG